MTSTLYDCGDVLAAVPDEDIRAAADFGLQFRVMFKAVARGSWMLHSDGILDLREAFLATNALKELPQVGILTADGFIYWTSRSPMTFNSSVILDSVPARACAAALPVRLELVDEFNDDRLWFAVDATVDGVSLLPATLVADAGVVDLFVQQVRDGRADSDEVVLRIDGRTVLALATNADPVDAFVDAPVDISVGDDVGGEGCSARPLPSCSTTTAGPTSLQTAAASTSSSRVARCGGTNLLSATTGGAGCDDAAASTVGWVVVTR